MSIHTQIPVAQVIREEDNEIGMFHLVLIALLKLEKGSQDQHQVKLGSFHLKYFFRIDSRYKLLKGCMTSLSDLFMVSVRGFTLRLSVFQGIPPKN